METRLGAELAFCRSRSLRSPILTRLAQSKEKGSMATRGRRRSSHKLSPAEASGWKETDLRAHAPEEPLEKPQSEGRDLRMREVALLWSSGNCSFLPLLVLHSQIVAAGQRFLPERKRDPVPPQLVTVLKLFRVFFPRVCYPDNSHLLSACLIPGILSLSGKYKARSIPIQAREPWRLGKHPGVEG